MQHRNFNSTRKFIDIKNNGVEWALSLKSYKYSRNKIIGTVTLILHEQNAIHSREKVKKKK